MTMFKMTKAEVKLIKQIHILDSHYLGFDTLPLKNIRAILKAAQTIISERKK